MFLSKRTNGIYYLWLNNGTRRQAVSCRTTRKDEALKFVQQFKAEHLGSKTVDVTLDEFKKEFLNYATETLSHTTVKAYRSIWGIFQRFIGDKMLKYVSVKDCLQFQHHLAQRGVMPSSVNEVLAKLHTAFQTGVTWNYLSDNPFKNVKRLKVQTEPPPFMTPEHITRFLETLPTFWRGVFMFALLTGSRPSELVNLRWEDLDFVRRTIQIGSKYFSTKTRKVRVLPMHDALFSMLQDMKVKANGSEFVFAKPNGQPYTAIYVSHVFKDAIRKLELPEELHLHSTRHTFASLLVQSGVPIYSVSKLLGHSSVQMTQVYAHLQPEQLSNEVHRLQITG